MRQGGYDVARVVDWATAPIAEQGKNREADACIAQYLQGCKWAEDLVSEDNIPVQIMVATGEHNRPAAWVLMRCNVIWSNRDGTLAHTGTLDTLGSDDCSDFLRWKWEIMPKIKLA